MLILCRKSMKTGKMPYSLQPFTMISNHGIYELQVAGTHKDNSKVLRGDPGKILKPYKVNANKKEKPEESHSELCIADAAFANEKDFYEMCLSDATLKDLKKLIPQYYGEEKIVIGDVLTPHLIIEDITHGFKKPCVADVKMGTTFDHPGSSLLKIERNKEKYPSHKEVGWCIAGLLKHSMLSDDSKQFGTDVGKKLSTKRTREEFKDFLCVGSPNSISLVQKFTRDVEAILRWFKSQRLYHFRASSLLFAYDADLAHAGGASSARCKMIDFAHVLKAGGEEDAGYILGLENILQLLLNTSMVYY